MGDCPLGVRENPQLFRFEFAESSGFEHNERTRVQPRRLSQAQSGTANMGTVSTMSESPLNPVDESGRREGRFKRVYWSDLGIDVQISGPDGEREVHLDQPFARIGSHPRSEIVLDHPKVARRHLYLHATPHGVYCIDFEYRKAFGHRVDYWVSQTHGVQVGPYCLRIQTRPRPVDQVKRDRLWNTRIPAEWTKTPVLTFVNRGKLMGRYPIRRRLISIGRHPLNNVRCKARTVSDFHAVLFWDTDKLWVIDLFSSGKTQLFNAEIDVSDFHSQTKLRLGRVSVSHSWTDDWKTVISEYPTLWQPTERSKPGSAPNDFSTGSASANMATTEPAAAEAIPEPTIALPLVSALESPEPVTPSASPESEQIAAEMAASLASVRQELHELEQSLQAARDQLSAAQRDRTEISTTLAAERAALETELAQLRSELQAAREEAMREQQQWQARVRNERGLLDSLREELDQRAAQVNQDEAATARQIADWRQAQDEQDRQLAAQRREMEDEREKLARLRSELEQRRQQLAQQQQALQTAADDNQQSNDLQAELARIRESSSQVALQLAQAETAQQQTATERDALRSKVETQTSELKALGNELQSVHNELHQVRHELQALRTDLETRGQELLAQRRELELQSHDLQVARDESTSLRGELELLQAELTAAQSAQATLRTEFAQSAGVATALQEQLTQSRLRQKEMEAIAETNRGELQRLTQTLAEREHQLAAAEQRVAQTRSSATAELEIMRTAVQEAEQAAAAATERVAAADLLRQNAVEQSRQQLADLEAELQASRAKIAILAEELQHVGRDLEAMHEAQAKMANRSDPYLHEDASPELTRLPDAVEVVAIPEIADDGDFSDDAARDERNETDLVQEALFDNLQQLRREKSRWRRVLRRLGLYRN